MSEEKLARKIFRLLPKIFLYEGYTYWRCLILNLNQVWWTNWLSTNIWEGYTWTSEKNNKNISFVSNTEEDENQGESQESLWDAITLISRKCNKSLKRPDRRWRTNVADKMLENFKNIGPQRKRKYEDKPNKGRWVQCHEC